MKTTYNDQGIKAEFTRNGDDVQISISATALSEESTDDAVKRILAALKYKLEKF